MQDSEPKLISRRFSNMEDLTPWINQQLQHKRSLATIDFQSKPLHKKMKQIIPRSKPSSQRKVIEKKSSIKIRDYHLPPMNKKVARVREQHSMTIDHSHQGKLIRNVSANRLKSSESLTYLLEQKIVSKFKLSGKKYDMIPQQKLEKWNSTERQSSQNHSLNNNTILLFSKKKDDILKRVLNQIQGRIKQLGISN